MLNFQNLIPIEIESICALYISYLERFFYFVILSVLHFAFIDNRVKKMPYVKNV